MRIKYSQILNILFVITISIIALSSQNIVDIDTLFVDGVICIYLILYVLSQNTVIRIKKKYAGSDMTKIFVVPWMIILIYSLSVQVLRHMTFDYIQHSIMLSGRMILYMLFVRVCYEKLRDHISIYLLRVLIICYIPSVLKHFMEYGIYNGLKILFSEEASFAGLALEVHQLSYIFGFLAVYFLFMHIYQGRYKSESLKYFWVSFIFMLLGVKRIATAATIVCIFILYIFKILSKISTKKAFKVALFGAFMMCPIAILYVSFIRNGQFENILNLYHINSMSRLNFWNYFRNRYDISWKFMGYGISFSHRAMSNEYMYIQRLGHATNLHNDVLGIYMGLGFVGSILYWYWFFYYRCKKVGQKSLQAGIFCFIILLNYFIGFMVSNGGLNPFNNAIVCLLVMVCMNTEFMERKEEIC